MSEKAVIVVDRGIPLGLLANAVAVVSFSLGQAVHRLCGDEIRDASGNAYRGVIRIPLPILAASPERMLQIRDAVRKKDFEEVVAIDFTEQAQRPQTYDTYSELMARTAGDDIVYRALALCGSRKLIEKLTGNLPLLR
ncbi:DUF2000 domain-containing protein [Bradyrhizobium erythrophlei]|uniref:DUF2000 domain-containing protein n=1 Tax=Bradyrhizobium erythrophlei TaxID=1437360 RepID=UPI0035E4FE4F